MSNARNADAGSSTTIELVAVGQLRPSGWNPRTITSSQLKSLCRSIQRDPALMTLRPIIATKDGLVVAGNMRLRAVQVDLDGAAVHVRASLQRTGNGYAIAETKAVRLRRQVSLARAAVDAPRRHRARQAANRLIAGTAWEDMDLVFSNEIGRPLDSSNVAPLVLPLAQARRCLASGSTTFVTPPRR